MKLPIVFNNIPPEALDLVAAASQPGRLEFAMRNDSSAGVPVATALVKKIAKEDQIVTFPESTEAMSLSQFAAKWAKA
jgi:hypothetical protein